MAADNAMTEPMLTLAYIVGSVGVMALNFSIACVPLGA